MTEFMRGQAEEVDVGIRGMWSLNNSVTTQEILPDFTLAPARIDPERDVVVGQGERGVDYDVAYKEANGGYEVFGEQVSFETARQVRYRPGGLTYAGAAVEIPSPPPAGRLDIGLGNIEWFDWDQNGNFTQGLNEVVLRLTSNGDWALVIRRDTVDTVIPRSRDSTSWNGTPAEGRSWEFESTSRSGELIRDQDNDIVGTYWALDKVDGTGPTGENQNRSGLDLDSYPLMIVPKLVGTWYGKGPYYLGFEVGGSGGFQRTYPAVAFQAKQTSITARSTLPLIIRYDDMGAGEQFTYRVYGRSGAGSGQLIDQPKTPWNFQDDIAIPVGATPADAELLMAYRRAPENVVTEQVNFRGTVFGIRDLALAAQNRSVIFSALDPSFGGQTPDWTTPTSVADQAETSIQVATQAVGGADLDADASTGTVQEATMVPGGGGANTAATNLDPGNQPDPRNKPLGIFAFCTDTAVNSADLLVTFEEQGA